MTGWTGRREEIRCPERHGAWPGVLALGHVVVVLAGISQQKFLRLGDDAATVAAEYADTAGMTGRPSGSAYPPNPRLPRRPPRAGCRPMIRVLVVDDHPVVREGLAALLATVPDVTVTGSTGDGATGVRLAVEHRPDVVLMDLDLPGVRGLQATREIPRVLPVAVVLVLTMVRRRRHRPGRPPRGGAGIRPQGHGQAELVGAIRTDVSLKTVQNHVSRVLAKMQVRDRTQAALGMRGLDRR